MTRHGVTVAVITAILITMALLTIGSVGEVDASPKVGPGSYLGPGYCAPCHPQETAVWKGTKHCRSFEVLEKNPKSKDILAAVGDSRSMRSSPTCTLCHFTMVKRGGHRPIAVAGPSCESCHGAAKGWIETHSNFGVADSRDKESQQHKLERHLASYKGGMRSPLELYEIASSCVQCHGMARPGLSGALVARMLEAGHSLEPEWELVRYSQGSVRHRFYPVGESKENHVMTTAELTRMFVVGQAARLLSASGALELSKDPGFRAAQKRRADNAREALAGFRGLPEVAAFLAKPTEPAARRVAETAMKRDLSGLVQGKLPPTSSYK